MKLWKAIENFIYLTLIVFLITVTSVTIAFNLQMKSHCTTITEIANNEIIIDYLNDWSTEVIIDNGYSYAFGFDGRITALKDGQPVQISQLPNSEMTGIETEKLWFTVHINSNDDEANITKENVSQLEFGRGRTAIIILKNNHELDSYKGYTLDSGRLSKVNENVYAYCDHGKF